MGNFFATMQGQGGGHALGQPGVIAGQFMERHPEAAGGLGLLQVRIDIDGFPPRITGGDSGQGRLHVIFVLAAGGAIAITGVLLGPAQCRPQQWQDGRGHEQGLPHQVVAVDVSQFVADVKVDGVRAVFQGVHHIGEQDDEAATQEPGGQGVEEIGAQQVGVRHLFQADFFTASDQFGVQIRVLVRRDLHPGAFQV